MKKTASDPQASDSDDMLPEYDFRGGVRGRHFQAYREGHTVKVHRTDGTTSVQVVLEPDVQEHFPDSESVNRALRTLIEKKTSKSA